jgi:hypothetical protein
VIDVGPSDGSEIPFLCTCGDEFQEWVTLSHCWGQNPPLKMTVSSLPDHQRGLPLDKLPKLFHDAVLITRDLGYRYLWIDSPVLFKTAEKIGCGRAHTWKKKSISTLCLRFRLIIAAIVETTQPYSNELCETEMLQLEITVSQRNARFQTTRMESEL